MITLPEALKSSGYKTAHIGKWHLGGPTSYPQDHGFEVNVGGNERGYPSIIGGYTAPYHLPNLEDDPKRTGEFLTDRLTREAIKFIREEKDKPFFLYLAFYSVHIPIRAKYKHTKYFKRKLKKIGLKRRAKYLREGKGYTRTKQGDPNYAGMLYLVDENIGKVLNELRKLNLEKDTIVVLGSDNGGLSTHKLFPRLYAPPPTNNFPLRAGKGWLYEGGIRGPLIIKWPRKIKEGIKNSTPVISSDLYPTLLDLANLPIPNNPKNETGDGVSLKNSLLENKKIDRDALYWHFPHYHESGSHPSSAVRYGNFKLIKFYENNKYELYDLKNDPGERNNLIKTRPRLFTKMKSSLTNWLKKSDAKLPIRR